MTYYTNINANMAKHYKTRNYYTYPRSVCNAPNSSLDSTEVIEEVTCKSCIRTMKRLGILPKEEKAQDPNGS